MHRNRFETAKNFKGSMIRLFKELKRYRVLLFLSLCLAFLGSGLSIFAPSQLSNLTNEIQQGLVLQQDHLQLLVDHIETGFKEEVLIQKIPEILALKMDSETVSQILLSPSYSFKDKENLQVFVKKIQSGQMEEAIPYLSELSTEVLTQLLPSSSYQGTFISSEDKISFLQNLLPEPNIQNIPMSILSVFLSEIEIDGQKISKEDQQAFLSHFASLENRNPEEIYAALEEAPDSIQSVVEPKMNMQRIVSITVLLIGFYLVSALFNFIESFSMTNVANYFARHLRGSISSKINRLPLEYFDQHQTGDILSRVTNDVDLIAQTMNSSLSTLVSAITLLIGSIVMMFVTNWIMACTAIFASLFGFFFMVFILGKSQKYFVERQKELGALNSHIEEVYSGIQVVKAYNGEEKAFQDFQHLNQNLYDCNRKSVFLSGLMMPMMNLIGDIGYVAVCIVGALLAMNHQITFGVIVAFISYVRLFTAPLSQIAQAMNQLQSTAAASERVFEFLDEKEMKVEEGKTYLTKEDVKGTIEFQHVVFQYAGNDKPTIHDFSFKAQAGSKIAIVGPTGAGKTTLVNLLMKFYEINAGDILIDGVSMKDMTRENVHELFTMVLQDTWLFSGTIKENIIYNRERVSDDDVKRVCETVGLDHFIQTLSHGYSSTLVDSESISSGQRQLLTIARGMIEDAPFLILDEATSNVDTRTEELVQKAMDKLMKGKTSFIIAHRLSTIKNADLILVMKEGNIVEQGTHEELMKQNGFYASLYNSQFEL